MKLLIVLLALLNAITIYSCKSKEDLPGNLEEAIDHFERTWSQSEIDSFRNTSEKDVILDLHSGTGHWIRNTWIYGKRDTALTNYFSSLGIYHPDDISSIILTSLHRKLNNKDINLKEQVERCQNYWQLILECEEKLKVDAMATYNKWNKGDALTIFMPVDTSNGSRNAFLYNCPSIEWQFDPNKDLVIKGILFDKYFINDSSNVFFTVYIKGITPKEIPILMRNTKVGDTRDFTLKGLKIE
jgi:hypothetical protein